MTNELIKELHDALLAVLKRDIRNTCVHEETHRGGAIWEICDQCGAKWADDEGGRPEWKDPSEWGKAQDALDKAQKHLADNEAFPQVSSLDQWERDCLVNCLYDKVDEYAELVRKNALATPIVCAIDEEQTRLKNLANKIARR